jgi:class 3 adenylate cyclase
MDSFIEPTSPGKSERPRQTKSEDLAIVFDDICNSSALGREHGDLAWIRAKDAHFDRFDRLAAAWGGRRVAPPAGDSCLAVLPDTLSAVRFACEINLRPGHRNIDVKVGVHRGMVHFLLDRVHGVENIYGWNVDFAKRVQEALPEKGVMLSTRVKEDIVGLLGLNQQFLRLEPVQALPKGFEPVQFWRIMSATRTFLRFR